MIKISDLEKLSVARAIANGSHFLNQRGRHVKVGAAIYKKNVCIAVGKNENKTHPLQNYYNRNMPFYRTPYLHAEIATLLAARRENGKEELKGCTIYVARKLNCGGWGTARPCPACWQALKDVGIKKVVYTTSQGYAVEYVQ